MGINISTTMGFNNQDFLKESAIQLLEKNNSKEDIAENGLYNNTNNNLDLKNSSLNVYMASTQISVNNSLMETLKYLKSHANNKHKRYVLGDLWNQISDYDDENYQGELINFEIDFTSENIFAA